MKDLFLTEGESYKRLYNEYMKHGSLTIGFDFDGTIHDFHKEGDSYPKVIQLLRDLKSINCKLICWTLYPDLTYVMNYLKDNDIPYDGVNTDGISLPWSGRKPFFNALLDDRSGLLHVYNDLDTLVYTIKNKRKKGS